MNIQAMVKMLYIVYKHILYYNNYCYDCNYHTLLLLTD